MAKKNPKDKAKDKTKGKAKDIDAKTWHEAIGIDFILKNDTLHFVIGVLLFIFTIFLFTAMCSYTVGGHADQSLLDELRSGEWENRERKFANKCGSIGAIMSYWLMSNNFGLAAFIVPLFCIVLSLRLMKAYTPNILKWFFALTVVMVWLSVTLSKCLTPLLGAHLHFDAGGKHGLYCVQQIENLFGSPGLLAVLLAVALVFLVVLSHKTIILIKSALNPIGSMGRNLVSTVQVAMEGGKMVDMDGNPVQPDDAVAPMQEGPIYVDPVSYEDIDPQAELAAERAAGIQPAPEPPAEPAQPDADASLTVEKVTEEEKADGTNLTGHVDLATPINPLEPFTNYKAPTLDLLKKYDETTCPHVDMNEIRANNKRIVDVLNSFGVKIKDVKATVGPTITLYEVTPAEGVKIARIRNLEDDIALCLSALGVRIIAPIPGKGTVGIEVPNKRPSIVSMESILNSKKFQETTMDLPLAIGKTITNEVFMVDLAKIPHLLVAGATGQGKSVGLNAIITSLLYKKHPNELKIVLVDPKKVEFSPYAPIADHFMAATEENVDEPIITDVTKVVRTLNSLCALMDRRYDLLKLANTKNIKEYNAKYINHLLNPNLGHAFMPYIVVVIDEFGDLIMTAGKEVELPIARIAQLARAVGIHMIIATQRPTTTIITGNIKANFPGRMAFRVGASVDSKTILDRSGANQLIGRGDLLFLNGGEPVRVQCAFVDTPEIERVNDHIAAQTGPICPLELPEPVSPDGGGSGMGDGEEMTDLDPFFEEAAHAIVISQQGSTSMIQRRFSIGYNRAGRLMDQLEQAGIVGAASGSKPRDVLITDENSLNALLAKIHGK